MLQENPLVSILVHTKNSQRTIKRHLESIKNQSYPKIEIIVADNNSTDKTKEICRRFTKRVFNCGPERSVQRNFAAKKAQGDYYLVPDSDMYLTKNVVKECVDLVQKNPQIKAVVIPEKTIGQGFWVKVKALERECYLGEKEIEAARFFEKKTFWQFNGYDEAITGPEDWDLPQRIAQKHQIGRIKSWILHDEGQGRLINYWKRKYYYGLSARKYLKKQKKRLINRSTIYFLRPCFYENWRQLIKKPILTAGLIILLTGEQIAGLLGVLHSFLKQEE